MTSVLKAREISAVSVALNDTLEAVLVQVGHEWNELREYRCISPGELIGEVIITKSAEGGHFAQMFDRIFGRFGDRWVIVMATPKIAAAIKPAAAKPEAPQPQGAS